MAFKDFKFIQYIRFKNANAEDNEDFVTYDFEIQNVRVSFQETNRQAELIDGTLRQFTLWYRPVFQFSSPYLRRAGEGSYDATDLFQALSNPDRNVWVSLPTISTGDYRVLKAEDSFTVNTERQFISPRFDLTLRGVNVVSEIPAWFKFTKNSPNYFL